MDTDISLPASSGSKKIAFYVARINSMGCVTLSNKVNGGDGLLVRGRKWKEKAVEQLWPGYYFRRRTGLRRPCYIVFIG
jgi:hypothetical protein